MSQEKLTHLNAKGEARMVDVSTREVTVRTATASGKVLVNSETLKQIGDGLSPKGDVLATARIAGIQGAKRTSELIPLCHPIAIHKVELNLKLVSDGVEIESIVKTSDRTGVEMEALTAVAVASLTLIDMIKSQDPLAQIKNIQVDSKSGGKNGDWQR
jgi:cyclic pyranopterin phosphate synthase